MRILSVAYPLAPVGPSTAGGAEQVLLGIDRALTVAGHKSTVIAAAGSQVHGHLVELPAMPQSFTDETRAAVHEAVRRVLAATLHAHQFDAVHFHGIDFCEYLPETPVPVLVTLHLPLAWYPATALEPRPGVWFHCVSDSQHAGAPPHFLPPIRNGVELNMFWPKLRCKHRYLLCAGRICPEKAQHLALDAARLAGWPILLAGDVFPYQAHQEYFEREIRPRGARFLGPVGGARKRRLFAGASAVLIPSLAPETSSLVAMEALASGTPVIAFPSGALSTLICPGRTGFLVRETAEDMAEAIGHLDRIRPADCRQFAETHFDFQRTADAYLSAYRRIGDAS